MSGRSSSTRSALAQADADSLRERGGLRQRLLICDTCRAVWPTERNAAHGGSRQDGEPCAYRWRDRVCDGSVHPLGYVRSASANRPETPSDAIYRGVRRRRWCEALELPTDTTDIAVVRTRYRELAKLHHPDVGGDHARMLEINEAYCQALGELGQP